MLSKPEAWRSGQRRGRERAAVYEFEFTGLDVGDWGEGEVQNGSQVSSVGVG